MLEELVVRNHALIERLEVRFSAALNILTGETGAGKSILIGALGLLLGAKADSDTIRAGAEETEVSGVIRVDRNPEALEWLSSQGLSPEEGAVVVRRVVKKNGKNACYIQSSPVPVSSLKDLTGILFDVHGQHEHHSLLNTENHRRLLDRFGEHEALVEEFGTLYGQLRGLREELAALVSSEKERQNQAELLEFAIREIDDAKLQPGEQENLKAEELLLANHEKLMRALEESYGATAESRGGAVAQLRQARARLTEALAVDPSLGALSRQLDNIFYEVEDFTEGLGRYRAGLLFDPGRLEQVEERLDLIRRLEKKFGPTVEAVLRYRDEGLKQLEGFQSTEETRRGLETQIAALEVRLKGQAAVLTDRRRLAGEGLQGIIEQELRQLGMPKVRFQVLIEERTNESGKLVYTSTGKDRIEFLISPNLGEPFRRLAQIASGGELSRIMLAIKSALAASDSVDTLIFDEIDAGIGGEVALAVGERLKMLSARKQVLCITHLATIAVRADRHLKVEKTARNERTVTQIETVTGAARREEVARMLAGDRKGDTSLRHAEELLERYGG
ncbi:MAG: DNA repair protein RecN [Spirochaetales bacterium]|nr:DNA repair protein RecN [Spirochaetales bacterium]